MLFCDLAGSTAIAAQLDPEGWRETVAGYHRAAAEAITRFGGHVAKYLGDGVMAFFGWPEAHDNDAERAALPAWRFWTPAVACNPTRKATASERAAMLARGIRQRQRGQCDADRSLTFAARIFGLVGLLAPFRPRLIIPRVELPESEPRT